MISLFEIPAFAIILPDNTKNGMARSKNLLIPEYIFVATIFKDVPEYKIAATDDKPKQIAIGIFNINKMKNVINKTALIIILPPYFS